MATICASSASVSGRPGSSTLGERKRWNIEENDGVNCDVAMGVSIGVLSSSSFALANRTTGVDHVGAPRQLRNDAAGHVCIREVALIPLVRENALVLQQINAAVRQVKAAEVFAMVRFGRSSWKEKDLQIPHFVCGIDPLLFIKTKQGKNGSNKLDKNY